MIWMPTAIDDLTGNEVVRTSIERSLGIFMLCSQQISVGFNL